MSYTFFYGYCFIAVAVAAKCGFAGMEWWRAALAGLIWWYTLVKILAVAILKAEGIY